MNDEGDVAELLKFQRERQSVKKKKQRIQKVFLIERKQISINFFDTMGC